MCNLIDPVEYSIGLELGFMDITRPLELVCVCGWGGGRGSTSAPHFLVAIEANPSPFICHGLLLVPRIFRPSYSPDIYTFWPLLAMGHFIF